MDPTSYQAPAFGRATREPGDQRAFWYFEPTHLARELTLDPVTVNVLSRADASLGYLQGLGQLISDPRLVVGPYITREAVSSSRIEGTQASLAEVLQENAAAEDEKSTDTDVAEAIGRLGTIC